jgi:hypothetical protein
MDSHDRIEKRIILRAPPSRVWQTIANAKEFGRWFGINGADDVGGVSPGEGRGGHSPHDRGIGLRACVGTLTRASVSHERGWMGRTGAEHPKSY